MTESNKAACTICRIIGGWDVENIEIEDVEFLVLRMSECGHGFVSAVLNDDVREKQGKVKEIERKSRKAGISGDESWLSRLQKRHQAAKISVQDTMRRLWKEKGHLIDEPPTDKLKSE